MQLRKAKGEHFSKYILDEFKPEKPDLPIKPDGYISLNILNQLDILLVDYLKRKNVRIVNTEIKKFRKTIQEFHLNWISKKPGCLITDVREINQVQDQEAEEKKLLYAELPKAKRVQEWIWDFDLSGNYHPDTKTQMKVKALEW